MPQHHGCAENHGSGVGTVSTHDVACNVSASRFEQSVFLRGNEHTNEGGDKQTHPSDVTSGDDSRSTNESGANVRDDSTVQVGHDHDVELARLSDQLHGTAIICQMWLPTWVRSGESHTCCRRSCR